jgi:fibronectin-binding autotransporter adhesin
MGSTSTTELIFSGTGNTFEGKIAINNDGTGVKNYRFAFASLADSTDANGRIVFALKGASAVTGSNGSVFEYTGTTPLVLDNRQIELASVTNPSNGHQVRSNGGGTLTVNTDLIVSTAVAQTLALRGTNTGNNTFAGKIGNGSGTVSLLKADAGLWILSGANTYTGTTTVAQGTLSINTIKDFGSSSAIGAPTSGAIQLGVGSNSGTLAYTGAGDSTNRTFQIGNATAANTGGGTISNNGSGALTFTATTFNNTIAGITATRTLTLGGTYVDGSNKIQGIIQDNVSTTGKVAITKSGDGTWVLTGANAYTGATTISGGKLLLGQGGSMGASAVSVTGTATYGMARTTSGDGVQGGSTLSLNTNTTLNLQDGYTNTLGFGSTGTLSGAGLYFDLGATTADKVELAGAATVTNANTFYFNVLGGTPKTGDHAYMLITAGSGLSTGGTFAIDTTLSEYNLALDTQADAVYLNVTLKRLPGDTNEDKVVDAADYITVKQNFGMTTGATWEMGNFDPDIDGNVDWDDLQLLMANFGTRSVPAPAMNTPEPATLFVMMAAGLPALLKRRRRRS